MNITYDTRKELPCDQLHRLFQSVGWTEGAETQEMLKNFNRPFLNSTIVVSAWEDGYLVGCVRVLSDRTVRSVIYDLAVAPEYHNKGIGKELLQRCIEHFPDSEWLVGTTQDIAGYYKKMGFTMDKGAFLRIPSKWF